MMPLVEGQIGWGGKKKKKKRGRKAHHPCAIQKKRERWPESPSGSDSKEGGHCKVMRKKKERGKKKVVRCPVQEEKKERGKKKRKKPARWRETANGRARGKEGKKKTAFPEIGKGKKRKEKKKCPNTYQFLWTREPRKEKPTEGGKKKKGEGKKSQIKCNLPSEGKGEGKKLLPRNPCDARAGVTTELKLDPRRKKKGGGGGHPSFSTVLEKKKKKKKKKTEPKPLRIWPCRVAFST